MAPFKLCYYGNGYDVTVPLAWIIKSEGEAEGKEDRCGDPVISALGPKLAIFDAQMPLSIPARAQQNSDFKDQLFP